MKVFTFYFLVFLKYGKAECQGRRHILNPIFQSSHVTSKHKCPFKRLSQLKVFSKKTLILLFLPAAISLPFISAVPRPDRAYCMGDMGFSISSSGCISKLKLLISFGVLVGELCGLFRP